MGWKGWRAEEGYWSTHMVALVVPWVCTCRSVFGVTQSSQYQMVVLSCQSGSRTLKDAVNEALRDWVTNIRTTHYIIGSAVGPHPFPDIVRWVRTAR